MNKLTASRLGSVALCAVLLSGCTTSTPNDSEVTSELVIDGPGRHNATGDVAAIASIQYDSPPDHILDAQRCSGVVVAPKWVLTAANCLRLGPETPIGEADGKAPERCPGPPQDPGSSVSWQFKIRLGATRTGTPIRVTATVAHPDFDFGAHAPAKPMSDIALLKLAEPANVKPIPIADHDLPPGTPTSQLGWGHQPVCTSRIPNELQQLDSVALPSSRCGRATQFEFCTATIRTASGVQGQCVGDSGAPILAQSPGGPVVAGVASRGGRHCGDSPGIYTSAAGFRQWINSVINSSGS
ncbi:S1 family peptidase [Amycolatopsis sp. cmx-4-68]|uniref:S1 family peptidase n=1 Tax=Amycolatopsis sp. cmx-4-68 TaxID=2790938 RepID=UPI0039793B1A